MKTQPLYPDDTFLDFETEEIPSEKDPFCNSTENCDYTEPYSRMIPAFFFRNKKCSRKPGAYEKKKLRYYYNTAGAILTSKLLIEAAVSLVFFIFMFVCSWSVTSSPSLYYSALSDATVKYAFRSIAVIISTASVFFAGCRFSAFSPGSIMKKGSGIRTSDIVVFFMSGLFVAAVSNIIAMTDTVLSSDYGFPGIHIDGDPLQIAATALYTCIVVPVADGLIFRGIALKNFSRASQRFGILTASFLCALSTCNFPAMIPAFLMSVLLCHMTVKYNSIIPSVLIHITVNASFLFISVYNTYLWESDLFLIKIWTIITLVIGGISTFIMLVRMPLPEIRAEQRRRTLPVLLTSVLTVLVIPFYIIAALAKILYFMYM